MTTASGVQLPLGASVGGPLADDEARHRIRTELGTTFFVEAAAGTGKTSALVGRMMSVLRTGEGTLDRIVAVTFTEKAAGEMKLRLRAEIESARTEKLAPDVAVRLEKALKQLEEARIGTIHGFCADLLHERPVEAGVDPLFDVAPQDVADRLLDEAFDDWFGNILADPPEGVRRVLRRRAGWLGDGPRGQLRTAAGRLVDHRDFAAAWSRLPLNREAVIDSILAELRELAALAGHSPRPDDYLGLNLREVARFMDDVDRLEAVQARDYDAVEGGLRSLRRDRSWRWKGYGEAFGAFTRSEAVARRDAVFAQLTDATDALDADLAPLLREELRGVVERYEAIKARDGRLDFLDLLIRARNLVRNRPAVRAQMQARFSHYFVDELQDTDPLQLELLLLLAADDPIETDAGKTRPIPGKLFVVGDPKQSIYRFRRADVAVYENAKARLRNVGAVVLQLNTSFRSVPGIQATVNAAFEPAMKAQPDRSQPEYVPLYPSRRETGTQPSVVALPVPAPYSDYGRVTQYAVEASLPEAVGAFIAWLVTESGWTVEEEEGRRVPVRASHVCVLLRRLQSRGADVTRPYVKALEARRVPHLLVGGRSFHDREEVLALRNALAAIEWPEDSLRVFATLKGPLFAFGDDTLLAFRSRGAALHPLARIDASELPDDEAAVAQALGLLASLHRRRNRRPIADTIDELLGAVRAHAGIALWRSGEQALANLLRVADRARSFEAAGAASFRAFVERLEDEALGGSVEEAPIVGEGAEGVRLMTVHKAKGLEFPVVILADPTYGGIAHEPSHYVDTEAGLWAEALCGSVPPDLISHRDEEMARDLAEAHRIAYVAATRARDLLVIPAVGDEELPGWLDVLNPALYPLAAERRSTRVAPGCPPFGPDSVMVRPNKAKVGVRAAVAPGLHTSRAGSEVVWWDPHALKLDQDVDLGLRLLEGLSVDDAGIAAAGIEAHDAWQKGRLLTLASGSVPERTVWRATDWAVAAAASASATGDVPAGYDPESIAVARIETIATGRPHGRRFGQLVHDVLASVDLAASNTQVRESADLLGRSLSATQEEAAAAAAAVAAALEHPLLREAAAGEHLDREVPVLLAVGTEGPPVLIEGVIDLAYRTADGQAVLWTVVDFKTDVELAGHEATYRAQVALYVAAVAAATGETVRGVLMVV